MEMQAVSSSHLAAVGYDAEAQELRVEFNSGKVFVYEGVPESAYDDLMSSASKGSYFHSSIRSSYSYHEA